MCIHLSQTHALSGIECPNERTTIHVGVSSVDCWHMLNVSDKKWINYLLNIYTCRMEVDGNKPLRSTLFERGRVMVQPALPALTALHAQVVCRTNPMVIPKVLIQGNARLCKNTRSCLTLWNELLDFTGSCCSFIFSCEIVTRTLSQAVQMRHCQLAVL